MTENTKTIARRTVTGLLLTFVATSLVTLAVQEVRRSGASDGGSALAGPGAGSDPGRQVVVTYFHRTARCISCRTIEAVARRTVESDFTSSVNDGRLAWRLVNLDAPGNEHYAQDYDLSAQSVVLVVVQDGKPGRWKNLDKVWDLLGDDAALAGYIRTEIGAFLKGS
jgi:hypothetical protein